jgi:lipoprotein-anchoring transpeptidase ErfK/SrfK
LASRRSSDYGDSVDYGESGPADKTAGPESARRAGAYIHDHGRDTLYRLHGNNEPPSIGKAVSSGCIRLLNQDVIHLASNVANGTTIVVIPDPAMASLTIGGDRAKS